MNPLCRGGSSKGSEGWEALWGRVFHVVYEEWGESGTAGGLGRGVGGVGFRWGHFYWVGYWKGYLGRIFLAGVWELGGERGG